MFHSVAMGEFEHRSGDAVLATIRSSEVARLTIQQASYELQMGKTDVQGRTGDRADPYSGSEIKSVMTARIHDDAKEVFSRLAATAPSTIISSSQL